MKKRDELAEKIYIAIICGLSADHTQQGLDHKRIIRQDGKLIYQGEYLASISIGLADSFVSELEKQNPPLGGS